MCNIGDDFVPNIGDFFPALQPQSRRRKRSFKIDPTNSDIGTRQIWRPFPTPKTSNPNTFPFVFNVASSPDLGGNPELSVANSPPASSPHFRPTMQSPGPPYQSK
ncbi:hypothetical protein JTE90_019043 [Oedothorax gibbosus]|uniref:Uncharacterized protein n=1 Tax=Oedothorax gibbosus TaxID=931172 RepID=A0AAV6V007_9ARAC|nr:hypothetical protein JTE90_019043 [Oedothorax gibbosus]